MILGLLQARVSSTRLPGKVLLPVLGEPLLARQLERVRRATSLDRLVVCTSDRASDAPLAELCGRLDVACFRGSLDDVLDRCWRAAAAHRPEHVVRLTGDCPLADPAVLDQVVAAHLSGGHDYTSNCLVRTFPDGLDVEVLRFACLEEARREARLPSEREHVTPFVWRAPERYDLGSVTRSPDLSHLRWAVDEPADLEVVRRIYAALYPRDPAFATDDVLALLAREPELAAGNAAIPTNAGWQRSLEDDRRFRAGGDAP